MCVCMDMSAEYLTRMEIEFDRLARGIADCKINAHNSSVNTMANIDVAFELTKDQRTRNDHFFEFSVDRIIIVEDSKSKFYLTNLFHNSFENLPLNNTYCYCPKTEQQLIKTRWRCRMLIARYMTLAIILMMFILASAQNENIETIVANSNVFNGSNWNSNKNQFHFDTDTQNDSDAFTNSNANNNQNHNSNNGKMTSGPGTQGVTVSRNTLINGDTILQRQLREKTKQDSLQSIKMHILMRLNLKKLPNITKPISVPQNIIEHFYKKYNASLLNSIRVHEKAELENSEKLLYVERNGNNTESTESKLLSSNWTTNSQHFINDSNLFRPITNLTTDEMQSDDPKQFDDYRYKHIIDLNKEKEASVIENDNGEYESILSHTNSIYVFPEQSHTRHNRKADVLRFKFDSYTEVSYVKLHLYLRGLDWIKANIPNIIDGFDDNFEDNEIVVDVHRAIRHVNSTHKVKMFEFRHKIPVGFGQWISVDLKPLFITGEDTMFNPTRTNKTQEIVIKGVEPWMKPLVVTTDNTSKNPLTVHIEIGSQKKHRRKRSVFMDCTESDHDMRCCRYPLKVNFTSFGWHFVVAPTSFDAYFCSGDCRVGYLEQYPHTHLAALTTSATPCCSPTKMSSLSLLYFDDNHNLVLSVIPNMSVEGCSCS
ncbi:growth/differentiation factor 8 isoform X2 [Drosophila nasuta]|uniref:growth/differentiation factor 8 isoform X2 n=1 Tax=Drosophila nasuta TaxID=42062 RepID=UPI00295EEF82|nr:growth/differentiation factor 8 isoform X2 [Drosophila nasuta]